MKKIYEWPAVVGISLTMGILYILCTFLIWLSPVKTVSLFGTMFHGIDLNKIIETTITFPSLLIGFIITIVITAAATFSAVFFYNLCLNHCIRKGWIKEDKK